MPLTRPARLGPFLAGFGAVGFVLSTIFTDGAPPLWTWLVWMGLGVGHSLLWRAAGVRRVSGRERRQHARRLKNAETRERRHLKATLRLERKMKRVLAEVREHPDMKWGLEVASEVRRLQEAHRRHEQALVHGKLLTEKTANELGELLNSRLDED